jgi:hypothetical protein
LLVVTDPAPAAAKIPETCTPECPPTFRVTGVPTWLVPLSKIVNVTLTGESSGLNTPTFVRNVPTPLVAGVFRIDVNTVVGCASEFFNPGMNIPTEFCGLVEYNRLVTTS